MLKDFYHGKKILVTGHTGFKGSWMCKLLHMLGSDVHGYSLAPPTNPCLFEIAEINDTVDSCIGDIREFDRLESFYNDVKPDVVFHLAAQPLVRESYSIPRETYETNVMGTVNLLECVRTTPVAKSVLNITTDKVYENLETGRYYQENDKLDGFDPYSNSKSCSELVTHSYSKSFFSNTDCAISTARAGNVIGGGDFAADRIVPDCVRAAVDGKDILVRNPNSIRPYQHVLEPLFAYLTIASRQFNDKSLEGSYNIGPNREDCVTTGELATLFCNNWGHDLRWLSQGNNGPHEANYLKLDNSLLKQTFDISPTWNISTAIKKTVEWTKVWHAGGDVSECMEMQINDYLKGCGEYV